MSSKKPKSTRAAGRPRVQPKPRMPAAIEIAIKDQRSEIGTAITLLYCLHSVLRQEEEGDDAESEAVAEAAEWVDITTLTAMLLVRLHNIHAALDCVTLTEADVDPERVRLGELSRKLGFDRDEREGS
jgi:hypothetical protein